MNTLEHLARNPLTWLVVLLVVFFGLRIWSLSRPRLCFMEFGSGEDAGVGPGPSTMLRALIRVEVHRLAAIAQLPDGRPLRFDLAGPYEDHYDLGSVSDGLPPVWKQVVALVGLIISQFGSKARVVTGILLPRERVVLGIETIHGGVRRTDMIALDDLEFPDPQNRSLTQLALPAAAWIILASYRDATLGGTPDWRSYTAFAAGYAWQRRGEAGDLIQARRLYTEACQDPRNTAAAVNLAALEQVDEREDAARPPGQRQAEPPADPLLRPSAQRLQRVVRVTAQRRAADPRAAARHPDLQWYRARYLLSSDLRDEVDRRRSEVDRRPAPIGGVADDEQAAPEAAAEALNYAIDLALTLEDERDLLPPDFVRFGRAAALTLVARQAFPTVTSENADDLAVAGQDRRDLTDTDVRAELLNLRGSRREPGTAERLVRYLRDHCRTDDQSEYNLLHYQLTRARIIRIAFDRWDGVLGRELEAAGQAYGPDLPGEVVAWTDKVGNWQRMLAQEYGAAVREAEQSRKRVEQAPDPDPVLVGLVRSLDDLDSPAGDADGSPAPIVRFARLNAELPPVAPDELERPDERPVFPSPPSPDVAATETRPRRRPDGPSRSSPDGPVPGGNGADRPLAVRQDQPRWWQRLLRRTDQNGPGSGDREPLG